MVQDRGGKRTTRLQAFGAKVSAFINTRFVFTFVLAACWFVGTFRWDKVLRGQDLIYAAAVGLFVAGLWRGIQLEDRAAKRRAEQEWTYTRQS